MDCSPLGSSVRGISWARILEWVAISFSRGSSWPRDQTHVSCIGRQILYHWDIWEALNMIKIFLFPVHLPWFSFVFFFNYSSHKESRGVGEKFHLPYYYKGRPPQVKCTWRTQFRFHERSFLITLHSPSLLHKVIPWAVVIRSKGEIHLDLGDSKPHCALAADGSCEVLMH